MHSLLILKLTSMRTQVSGWRQFNIMMLIKFIACIIAFSLEKY